MFVPKIRINNIPALVQILKRGPVSVWQYWVFEVAIDITISWLYITDNRNFVKNIDYQPR